MDGTDRIQDLMSRFEGARRLATNALALLAELHPHDARRQIEALRDATIKELKQDGIAPEREMDYAKIVGPALEVVEMIVEQSLRDIHDR